MRTDERTTAGRKSITVLTRKLLWQASGGVCAYEGCNRRLVHDADNGEQTVVGQEAHIVSRKPDGPRAKHAPPGGEINGYQNLILLCSEHHKVVDDNPESYSVNWLVERKREHESWVRERLDQEADSPSGPETVYAGIVDGWADYVQLDEWNRWTAYLITGGPPSLNAVDYARLSELRHWLVRRSWPEDFERLEDAFHNFNRVLGDFLEELKRVGRWSADGEWLEVEQSYKNDSDPSALQKYERNAFVVAELAREATRAANLIVFRVQQDLDLRFRWDEGFVAIQELDGLDTWITSAYRYPSAISSGEPYRGLSTIRDEAVDGIKP